MRQPSPFRALGEDMAIPEVPEPVAWRSGLVLEPEHFQRTDRRQATIAHLGGLLADPWPWGFTKHLIDGPALAAGRLQLACEGLFPDGGPLRAAALVHPLDGFDDGEQASFCVVRAPDGESLALQLGTTPAEGALPAARLVLHRGVWSGLPGWSPPALLIGDSHPIRDDMNYQLGALAALGAGFSATLRVPGAEERPGARTVSRVAGALAVGIGVLESLLASPTVSPGRLGIEALRLALEVRAAAGVFDRPDERWDPVDQRGSLQRLLYLVESTASGIGLPFRANAFRLDSESGRLLASGIPTGQILLAIEAGRPADLIAARAWFDGAALAAPERIQEALDRRVAGCRRRPIERDPVLGVSSGPLLGLYRVEADPSWRGMGNELALAATTAVPANASFSLLIAEGDGAGMAAFQAADPGLGR